jgi:hypothetical protein
LAPGGDVGEDQATFQWQGGLLCQEGASDPRKVGHFLEEKNRERIVMNM